MSADPNTGCLPPLTDAEYVLGVVLFIGTILSFLPQILKIALRKSHGGISVVRFCLALTGTTSSLLYYSCLSSTQTFYCCTSTRQCFSNLLPVMQIFLIIACEVVLIILCMVHFDMKWLHEHNHDHHGEWQTAHRSVQAALSAQTVMIVTWFIMALSVGFGSGAMDVFGTILIGVASVMVIVNILPQIYWTFVNKSLGSLSLPTLALQSGGSLLNALFYSFTNPWYIWIPPLLAGCLLGVLFVEGLIYHRLEAKKKASRALNDFSAIQ